MITECRTDELLNPRLVPAEELALLLHALPGGGEDDDEHDELDEDENEDDEDEDDEDDENDEDDEDDEEAEDEEEDDEDDEEEDDGAPREATGLGSVMLPRLHQLYSRGLTK